MVPDDEQDSPLPPRPLACASAQPDRSTSRREQLISHAADLLREGGPRALTSVAVAERMGVTQPAVYRHVRDMEELSALAADVVVADLNATARRLLLDSTIDWTDPGHVGAVCRDLVEQAVRNQGLFDMIARFRYSDGALGDGIRNVINADSMLIELLLETRWRDETGHTARLDARQRAALSAHAMAIHDDAHTVARLAYARSSKALRQHDVADILQQRAHAGWLAFSQDMTARVR